MPIYLILDLWWKSSTRQAHFFAREKIIAIVCLLLKLHNHIFLNDCSTKSSSSSHIGSRAMDSYQVQRGKKNVPAIFTPSWMVEWIEIIMIMVLWQRASAGGGEISGMQIWDALVCMGIYRNRAILNFGTFLAIYMRKCLLRNFGNFFSSF